MEEKLSLADTFNMRNDPDLENLRAKVADISRDLDDLRELTSKVDWAAAVTAKIDQIQAKLGK